MYFKLCKVISGNMWSQQWNNIADLVNPFKNKQLMDVTEEMKRQVRIVDI